MDRPPSDNLPPEAELALAWSKARMRGPLGVALSLDQRLARIVRRSTEPMLGQMRLAWWRDALGTPVSERPRGDVVLDGLGQYWQGREGALTALIDAWEVLLTAERLGRAEAETFGMGRGAFFAALAPAEPPARLKAAGFRWALADAAAALSDPGERAVLVTAGLAMGDAGGRMPRGLAVLEALARRGLRRGGRPLMEGRGASLTALRAAIFLT